MATVVTLTAPSGTVLNLTDGSFGYRLGDMGLGLPPLHRLEERGPLQNGVTDLGYRLDPRIVHLALFAVGGHNYDYWNARQKLMAVLRPQAAPLKLTYNIDTSLGLSSTYYLDCYYAGGMELDSKDRRGFGQNLAITLRAPSPAWYILLNTYPQSLTGGVHSIPADPRFFFYFTASLGNDLHYFGSAAENPIIKLIGPLTGPIVVSSITTGEQLIYNYSILGTDNITIDTRYGYKTVVDSSGGNQIAGLAAVSNMATFHLSSAAFTGVGGAFTSNEFTVTAIGYGTGSAFQLIYKDRYIGI